MRGFRLRKSGRKELIADIFLPNRCPFCDNAIHWDIYCCDECYENALWADTGKYKICVKCGRYACVCGKEKFFYDYCAAAGIYEDEYINSAVLSLKMHNCVNAAEIFSEKLSGMLADMPEPYYDLIVPVPMNSRKRRARGYNQAAVLATALSRKMNVSVNETFITRKYSSASQHSRTAEERESAAVKEYVWNGNKMLSGERVIICDDIMTTGATVSRCARLLKNHGASVVTAAVCAKAI